MVASLNISEPIQSKPDLRSQCPHALRRESTQDTKCCLCLAVLLVVISWGFKGLH